MLSTEYKDARGHPIHESVERLEIDGKPYELKIITSAVYPGRIETNAYGCRADGFCMHDPAKDFRKLMHRRPGSARWATDKMYSNQHTRELARIDVVRDLMRTHYAAPIT